MKLCVTCSTYNRPHLLPRTIACFEAQDYEDRYMVIFDDGAQYQNQEGDRWRLVSVPKQWPSLRCKSLGAKRNLVLGMVPPGTDAILPCDDDDLFLPWHLSSAAKALENADWSRPSVILTVRDLGGMWIFSANYTGSRANPTKERLYHPAWAVRLDAIKRAGGYPENLSGPEDQGLMRKMEQLGIKQADPIELGCKPSYVYCWDNGRRTHTSISALLHGDPTGEQAWKKLGKHLEPATLEPWTPPFDLHNPIIAPGIAARPF
jgi:hypothetical protein